MNIPNLILPPRKILELEPTPGAEYGRCIDEAKELAKKLKGAIKFKHNGREVLCLENTYFEY